jgi:hypothetical protein
MDLGGYGSAGEQPERPGPTVDRAESVSFSALFFCPIDGLESDKLIFRHKKTIGMD